MMKTTLGEPSYVVTLRLPYYALQKVQFLSLRLELLSGVGQLLIVELRNPWQKKALFLQDHSNGLENASPLALVAVRPLSTTDNVHPVYL